MNALALVNNQNALMNSQILLGAQSSKATVLSGIVGRIKSKWDDLNDAIQKSQDKSKEFSEQLKEVGRSIFSLDNAKLVFNATVGGAAKAREQLIGFQNMMGDKDIGKEYLDNISKKTIQLGFSPDEGVNNSKAFMSVTRNTDKLDRLNTMSQKIAVTNPEKGVGEAGAAIKNALIGKYDDLQLKYSFSVDDTALLKGSANLGEFMDNFDKILNSKKIDDSNLKIFSESPMAQVNQLKNNIDDALSGTGEGALNSLIPIISNINKAFSEGKFDFIFNTIAVGLSIVSDIALIVADVFERASNVIRDNWGTIVVVLFYIAAVLAAVLIPTLWQSVLALIANAQAWILTHLPIMLIVGAIFLLIFVLTQYGVTFEQIIGFIGGALGVFFAFIWNNIAWVWNHFAIFAEFLANVFKHPLYSAKRLFFNIWNSIVGFVGQAIDFIIGLVKKVPFLGDLIGDFSVVEKFTADIEEPPDDYYVAPKMDYKNFNNEMSYGYSKGASIGSKVDGGIKSVLDKKDSLMNSSKLDEWNKNQKDMYKPPTQSSMPSDKLQNNFNTTNENLQNGNDKIDISNEHLEMLRDLAEIESVQNFVTLTPSVEITTGDIKEEADINTIISKIENYMKTELVNSAEGVYV